MKLVEVAFAFDVCPQRARWLTIFDLADGLPASLLDVRERLRKVVSHSRRLDRPSPAGLAAGLFGGRVG
jgi:hypothetical protein